jgi:hypothetical protein
MTRSQWMFDDPPNAATITVRQIIDGGEPILLVVHDADDGTWQFLTGGDFHVADAMLASLKSMVERDPTLADLADLECGWEATHERVDLPWKRSVKS